MTMTTTTKEAPLFLHSKGRCYNHEWCGPSGVVEGLRQVHYDWKPVTFIVADHHTKGDQVYHRAVVAAAVIDDEVRWRWCGEGDTPDGAGSSTICDFEPEDFELAIATVMMNLATIQGRHPDSHIFRERLSV